MADRYLPGTELHLLDDAPMAGDGGARTIWHITWDKNATAAAPADLVPFDNLVGYFTSSGSGAAPHLIWDPFTGRIAQLFSATSRSKSVINAPGGVETNRKGDVCIQIETLFFPYCRVNGKVYATVADTPCKGLDRIMAWLRSWGVPDVWPMGAPDWSSHRNATVWNTQSGHYGHSQVPENDHTDPGPMPNLFTLSQEDDMPYSEADLTRIVSAAVASPGVRDTLSWTNQYWLLATLTGQVPDGAPAAQQQIIPPLRAAFLAAVNEAVQAQLKDTVKGAVAEALASGLTITVGTKAGA